jgi:hypothetical protein
MGLVMFQWVILLLVYSPLANHQFRMMELVKHQWVLSPLAALELLGWRPPVKRGLV